MLGTRGTAGVVAPLGFSAVTAGTAGAGGVLEEALSPIETGDKQAVRHYDRVSYRYAARNENFVPVTRNFKRRS